VPDLEHIARYYLETVAGVREGVPHASERHEWATIWLFDQMVRTKISGEMGEWVTKNRTSPVLKEIGGEIAIGSVEPDGTLNGQAPVQPVMTLRNRLADWLRRRYTPDAAADTGELHRWMYDEISLKALLKMAGFREVVRCTHAESRIDDWDSYGFDEFLDGSPTQPGSLWMEAIK
jgi:hypothetical protein